MPNPLTGDFEALLQVSGKTIKRLLASMHQNAGNPTTTLPTFPHSRSCQLGYAAPGPLENVRGSASVQIASPTLQFAHAVQDRVTLKVWVRAHYRADPGTTSLPEFIHGEVSAEYLIDEAFHPRYGNQLRLRVIPDNVRFSSAGPDTSADAAIARQVARLLQTSFQMKPHPIVDEFRQRRLRSLIAPDGTQAVVIALALSTPEPHGNLATVNTVLLAGRDFAVAISQEFVVSRVQRALDQMKVTTPSHHFVVEVKVFGITVDEGEYEPTITVAQAGWALGTGMLGATPVPAAAITLHIEGHAITAADDMPNVQFTIDDSIALVFDPATETILVQPSGDPSVGISAGVIGFLLKKTIRASVKSVYNSLLAGALTGIGSQFQPTTAKAKLVSQLQSLDTLAGVTLDAAEYTMDGIVLRGAVSVAPRAFGVVKFERLKDYSGFTAFESWLPGGRIDRFTWNWRWFNPATGPYGTGATAYQTQVHLDRFELHSTSPLPGLGYSAMAGVICLSLTGIQVDPVSGDDVSVTTLSGNYMFGNTRVDTCLTFYPPKLVPWSRKYLKIWLTDVEVSDIAFQEWAVVDAGAGPASPTPFNTLLYYVDAEPSTATLAPVAEAVRSSVRADAGVLVLVLFREGLLASGGTRLASELEAFAADVGAPVLVSEDVSNGWSTALDIPAGRRGVATRLFSPDGQVAWAHQGPIEARALAAALREHLRPSRPPSAEPVQLAVAVGESAPDFAFELASGSRIHLARLRGQPLMLCFVQAWSMSSRAELRQRQRFEEALDQHNTAVIVIVDDEHGQDARTLQRDLGPAFAVISDRDRRLATRYGVRLWPTAVMIDAGGIVTSIEMGSDQAALRALAREHPPSRRHAPTAS